VIASVTAMNNWIDRWSSDKDKRPEALALAKEFASESERVWPNSGTEEHHFTEAVILHPYFKGYILKKLGVYEEVVDRLSVWYNEGGSSFMFVDPSKVSNLPTSIEELEDEIDMMMDQDNVRSVSVGAIRTFSLAFLLSAKKQNFLQICNFNELNANEKNKSNIFLTIKKPSNISGRYSLIETNT